MSDYELLFVPLACLGMGYLIGQAHAGSFYKTAIRALLQMFLRRLKSGQYFSPFERAIIIESQKLVK